MDSSILRFEKLCAHKTHWFGIFERRCLGLASAPENEWARALGSRNYTIPCRIIPRGEDWETPLNIPGKCSLSSHPILRFRQRAYRGPFPAPAECWKPPACPAQSGFWTMRACPPLSAARPCHNKLGDHWLSVLTGTAVSEQASRLMHKAKPAEKFSSFFHPQKETKSSQSNRTTFRARSSRWGFCFALKANGP